MSEFWLLWTVRLALAAYAARLAVDLRIVRIDGRSRGMRGLWLAGALLLLAHGVIAFVAVHHGSHAEAYASTARQTRELTGFDWGGGLYLNELTIALWLADALWACLSSASYDSRPTAVGFGLHVWLLFMAVNGAIVFESGPTRLLTTGVLLGVAVLWIVQNRRGPRL